MNRTEKYLWKVDWQQYLERDMDLFTLFLFVDPYGKLLENETGFAFKHQLHTYSNNKSLFYRSKKELEAADIHFSQILKTDRKMVLRYLEKEKECHFLLNNIQNENNPAKIIQTCKHIILYNTVIPFRLLSSLSAGTESDFKDDLEKIRQQSLYPKIIETLMSRLFKKAAQKLDIPELKSKLLTPSELVGVLSGDLSLAEADLDKRNMQCFFYLQNDKLIFVDNILKFCTRFNPNTSTLQGNSAYPGRVQGVVQIVNSPTQISDFSSGNILVTVNGNPSIGVALKKAGAIVADEGGLACHAAILAREYKIPCVMGTCKGTKFLKNGDLVRIDATKGIVKIIENVK